MLGGFGELIRNYRVAAGLTQEELALRTGLGMRTISDIERGRTTHPRRSSIDLLCRTLGLATPPAASPAAGRGAKPSDGRGSRIPVAAVALASTEPDPAGPPPGQAAVPRQLPPAIGYFAGRAAELRALSTLLDPEHAGRSAVVPVISGTAGVGKTALAVQWAYQAARLFPDGQLYVDLGGFGPAATPMTPTKALRYLLNALQVPAKRVPAGLQARAALYRSLLAGRRMLIILDNARDTAQVRPLLPGGGGCVAIVTSRSQLTSLVVTQNAHPLLLDVLSEAEARELLCRRLDAGHVRGDAATVSELVRLCARLPLALAIVAARAAVGPSHLLPILAEELRDARRRLDALDAGDPAASAAASFSWSYQSLPGPAAHMFRLLSAHPGPDISVRTAASLAGLPLEAARKNLRELTQASMLTEPTPGRFALHDLLRTYAAEQARSTHGHPQDVPLLQAAR